MADELQVTIQVVTSKFTDSQISKTLQQDQAASLLASDIATFTTTGSKQIDYGSMGTSQVGYCYLESLASTTGAGSIIWGKGTTTGLFEAIGELKGTEVAIFRINTSTRLYAQGSGGSGTMLSKIYGD